MVQRNEEYIEGLWVWLQREIPSNYFLYQWNYRLYTDNGIRHLALLRVRHGPKRWRVILKCSQDGFKPRSINEIIIHIYNLDDFARRISLRKSHEKERCARRRSLISPCKINTCFKGTYISRSWTHQILLDKDKGVLQLASGRHVHAKTLNDFPILHRGPKFPVPTSRQISGERVQFLYLKPSRHGPDLWQTR